MKKIILSIVIAVSAFTINANAQVGIQTSNPQGVFDIDGARDNPATGVPTVAQQANDISVTATGSLGIGTTAPTNKLHVVASTASSNRFTLIDALVPAGSGSVVMALRNTSPLATGSYSLLGFSNTGPLGGGASWGLGSIRTGATATDGTAEDFFVGNSLGGNYLERMRINATGNVGIAVSVPLAKLHVEGTETRLSNGASAWGLDPEGTSPTSQFSIIDRTSNVRRLVLLENGNAFMGGTLGTNGTNATISSVGGSVGIGNNGSPTNTLDVNGTTRVRTISLVGASNAVTPIYSDANGVLTKTSVSATYGAVISNTVSVASGATAVFIAAGMVDGAIYKAVVSSGDACAYAVVADYFVFNIAANNNFSIRGISGLISNSTNNTKAPTFNEIDKNTTATSWTGKPTCADTGNTTALNFTLSMPSGSQINVKNDGNITRSYTIVLTRLT